MKSIRRLPSLSAHAAFAAFLAVSALAARAQDEAAEASAPDAGGHLKVPIDAPAMRALDLSRSDAGERIVYDISLEVPGRKIPLTARLPLEVGEKEATLTLSVQEHEGRRAPSLFLAVDESESSDFKDGVPPVQLHFTRSPKGDDETFGVSSSDERIVLDPPTVSFRHNSGVSTPVSMTIRWGGAEASLPETISIALAGGGKRLSFSLPGPAGWKTGAQEAPRLNLGLFGGKPVVVRLARVEYSNPASYSIEVVNGRYGDFNVSTNLLHFAAGQSMAEFSAWARPCSIADIFARARPSRNETMELRLTREGDQEDKIRISCPIDRNAPAAFENNFHVCFVKEIEFGKRKSFTVVDYTWADVFAKLGNVPGANREVSIDTGKEGKAVVRLPEDIALSSRVDSTAIASLCARVSFVYPGDLTAESDKRYRSALHETLVNALRIPIEDGEKIRISGPVSVTRDLSMVFSPPGSDAEQKSRVPDLAVADVGEARVALSGDEVSYAIADGRNVLYISKGTSVFAKDGGAWHELSVSGGRIETPFVQLYKGRWHYITNGLANTLTVALCAVLLGAVLGFLVGVIRATHDRHGRLVILNAIAKVYITVIRGTPMTVQLLIAYFIIFSSLNNKVLVAILAFGFNSGAYVAEIIRAGITSIDDGQMEAARALGLSYGQGMRRIVLPQAIRNILPALGNEFIVMLKDTSIASFIGLDDLARGGSIIRSQTYQAYIPFLAVAAIYLVLVMIFSKLLGKLEHHLRRTGAQEV